MFCKNCGKELSANEKFCTQCGKAQEAEVEIAVVAENTDSDKTTEDVVMTESVTHTEQDNISVGINNPVGNGEANKSVSKVKRFFISLLPGKKSGISSKEQKRNRIIAAILVILLVLSGVVGTDENSMVISVSEGSEYYGGVAFNLTFEEFVEQYNTNLYEVYDQYTAELNEIKLSDFKQIDAEDKTNIKMYYYEYYALTTYNGLPVYDYSDQLGMISIGVDKTNGYIQSVTWGVTDSAINATEECANNYLFTEPSRFFSLVDSNLEFGDESAYKEIFDEISEGEQLWQGDSLYIMNGLVEGGGYLFEIRATTSDSEWTKN